ncbi:MAG: hypothetical protein ACUVWX_10515 [Kiritimatiellia bacterium]
MRSAVRSFGAVLVTLMLAMWWASAALALGPSHRIGLGGQYDMVSGDTDDAWGGYLYYVLDLPKPMAVMLEAAYVTGEFDVEAGAGDYAIMSLAGAILVQRSSNLLSPYAGVGVGRYFTDFDEDRGSVRYEDKYGMFVLAGTRLALGGSLSADVSVRYRVLHPSSLWPIKPNPIDMDAWSFRIGLTLDL